MTMKMRLKMKNRLHRFDHSLEPPFLKGEVNFEGEDSEI